MGKNDPRILAIVTREFIEVEACYHKSCYRDYTRNFKELLAVVIRKRKMSVLNIPMQNHKPMRICLPTSKHVCSKTRGLLEWLSCTPYLPLS